MTVPVAVTVGSATDVGCVRQVNEDASFGGGRVFLVADGMGGHAAGDVASALTVEVFATLEGEVITSEAVRGAVVRANEAVRAHAATHPESVGLGTTVAGLALLEGPAPHWAVFNVGDSRVYLFRDGVLRQLTIDHSEVQELVDQGLLSPEEAAVHPSRHVITRAVGEETCPEVDVVVFPVATGGRFIACTDGLTTELADEEVAAILAANHPPQDTARILVRRALEQGGSDNVTVVVVDEPASGTSQRVSTATNPRNRS